MKKRKRNRFAYPTDGDTRQKSMDGDGALYLATYGVLNSSHPDTGLLTDLIKAGMCEKIRSWSFKRFTMYT